MILVLNIILAFYSLAILALVYGITKVQNFDVLKKEPKTKFSIVVPFRNEAHNLPILLQSFSKLNYPKDGFEVILVDDDSEEEFNVPNSEFRIAIIKNIRISNSPKKDAISTAIQIAKNDWIITTDADCTVDTNWLFVIDNYIQSNDVWMIAGAISYYGADTFLHHFQQLDILSLQGATIGSFGLNHGFMCNGANFAYTKTYFQELNGFEGNTFIASGDDVFLLQKAIKRNPEKVHYLKSKNNIVRTAALNDWKSLYYQRVRWASKTSSYSSKFGKCLGWIVFGGNLTIVVGGSLWGIGLVSGLHIFCLFFSKFIVDSVLIYKTHTFLTNNKIRYLVLSSLVYPFFCVSVALYSIFGKYEWKGRRFTM
jgi:glycosyltransferase involved in cell wall biosynthesis